MRAAIFDYDGVIADGFEANFLGWERCFLERGLTGFDRQYFRTVYGTGARNIARPILERNNAEISEAILLELIRIKSLYAADYADRIALIPGIDCFLKRLDSFKRAIATGNSRLLIECLNKQFGIERYFEVVVGSEDVQPDKHDPKGFLIAASRLGVPPENCLVIEDAPLGVEAAKRCGMKCLAITTTKPCSALTAADLVVGSYEAVSDEDLAKLSQ